MKNLLMILAVWGTCLELVSCGPTPPKPHDLIWNYLSKSGYHVVDVTMIVSSQSGETNTGEGLSTPYTLCQSAPYGAAFRAYQNNVTIIGVACLEQDNTVTIVLQK